MSDIPDYATFYNDGRVGRRTSQTSGTFKYKETNRRVRKWRPKSKVPAAVEIGQYAHRDSVKLMQKCFLIRKI